MDYIEDFFLKYLSAPCLLSFGLLYARLNSAYHPDFLFKKHIILKSNKLSKLLVSDRCMFGFKKHTKNENRDKMSVAGVILYVTSGIAFVFWLISLFLDPEILSKATTLSACNLFLAISIDTINSFPVKTHKKKQ